MYAIMGPKTSHSNECALYWNAVRQSICRPFGLKAFFLVIEADTPCYIPKDLPNLVELVLCAKIAVEVSFEEPVTLFSAIKT